MIAPLLDAPVGIGLVTTATGALVVWTTAIGNTVRTTLFGLQLVITGDQIASSTSVSAFLTERFTDFGFVGDGARRFLLSATTAGGAMYQALDAGLQPIGSSVRSGATISSHGVAEPIAPGGPFVAGWVEGGDVLVAEIDDAGNPAGPIVRRPSAVDVAVRQAVRRDVIAWTTPDATGCGVWAFDDGFAPLLPDPLIHMPAGPCEKSAITRHEAGTNLLMWIAGGAAFGQLGTDTDVVGAQLSLGRTADDLELVVAPTGFFYAIASSETVQLGHVTVDGSRVTALGAVPHLPGSAIRLVAYPGGALLLGAGTFASVPVLSLTRLCDPG